MLHFRYHATMCYFIESSRDDGALLAVDAGWPCTFHEYRRHLKSTGHTPADIKWAMATHYHMDHAGLIGEFLRNGIACFLFENQTDESIDLMERTIMKGREYATYTMIDKKQLTRIGIDDFNEELARLGISGKVFATPGHSPDSVSFVTGIGEALIGDLAPLDQLPEDDARSRDCYRILGEAGARTIYPGHAEVFDL